MWRIVMRIGRYLNAWQAILSRLACSAGSGLLIVLLASCQQTATTQQSGRSQQDSPEATVQSYYEAFNRGDIDTIRTLLDDSDASNKTALEAIKATYRAGRTVEFSNIETRPVENDGHTARLYGLAHMKIQQGDQVLSDGDGSEPFTLVNKSGRWYIVGAGMAYPPGWTKQ